MTSGALADWLWASHSIPAALVDAAGTVERTNPALTEAAGRDLTGGRLDGVVVEEHRPHLSEARAGEEVVSMMLACFADERAVASDHLVSVIPAGYGRLVILERAHHEEARLARALLDVQLELAEAQRELGRQKKDLEIALSELRATTLYIRKVEGILPICSGCRKVRDDEDDWVELSAYLMRHENVNLSHGYCPDCLDEAASGI